jgi:hypothetical protein
MQTFQWAIIGIFLVSVFTTLGLVSSAVSTGDTAGDMKSAITNVTVINSILILLLGGLAFFFLETNTVAERTYVIIMVHFSLLLSITCASVMALQTV